MRFGDIMRFGEVVLALICFGLSAMSDDDGVATPRCCGGYQL